MTVPVMTEAEFIDAWHAAGCSPARMAKSLGIDERAIYARRRRMQERGIHLPTVPTGHGVRKYTGPARNYAQRAPLDVPNGRVIVFSDAHWWPGVARTAAHEALLILLRELKPEAVIANGDVFDGAKISRHDPDGWTEAPSVHGELEAVKSHMAEIAEAASGARLLRTIGNHDKRFDTRLAVQVPDYRHLAGMQLRDHLPDWAESWSVEINGAVIVKHRWHNGVHGAYNNALKGGRSIVTGHLHRLQASPWTDYNGRRWGVDCGTLSEPSHAQFDYAEDSAKNWGSGFAVLTFRHGQLTPPELCEVVRGAAYFRGEVVHEEGAHQQPRAGARKTAAGAGDGKRDRVRGVRGGMDSGAHDKPAPVQVPGMRQASGAAR